MNNTPKVSDVELNHVVRMFDSTREAVGYSQKFGKQTFASHRSDMDEWAGGSYDECVTLATQGWMDARPNVEAILEPVREHMSTLLSDVPDRFHDITGFEPNIERYIDGEFECMIDEMPIRILKEGKVFTLLINGCFDNMVKKETVFARGAAICALVESLQMLGCDLNIWVETTVRSVGRKLLSTLTKVHDAGENLDINNVMFPIGHPGWLRRIVFGIMEGETVGVRKNFNITEHGGYGVPTSGTMCGEMVNPSFVMTLGASHRDQDITDPVGWVLKQLAAQGLYDAPDEK